MIEYRGWQPEKIHGAGSLALIMKFTEYWPQYTGRSTIGQMFLNMLSTF
jgi:hypothetical protein